MRRIAAYLALGCLLWAISAYEDAMYRFHCSEAARANEGARTAMLREALARQRAEHQPRLPQMGDLQAPPLWSITDKERRQLAARGDAGAR